MFNEVPTWYIEENLYVVDWLNATEPETTAWTTRTVPRATGRPCWAFCSRTSCTVYVRNLYTLHCPHVSMAWHIHVRTCTSYSNELIDDIDSLVPRPHLQNDNIIWHAGVYTGCGLLSNCPEHNLRWQRRTCRFVTCVAADNTLLECFAKSRGWNFYDSMNWYQSVVGGSSVICQSNLAGQTFTRARGGRVWPARQASVSHVSGDEHTLTDFSRILKGVQTGYIMLIESV